MGEIKVYCYATGGGGGGRGATAAAGFFLEAANITIAAT